MYVNYWNNTLISNGVGLAYSDVPWAWELATMTPGPSESRWMVPGTVSIED